MDERSWTGDRSAINAVATIVIVAAVVIVTQWWDRAYRRWVHEDNLLAGSRARLDGVRVRYRQRREFASELAEFVVDLATGGGEASAGSPVDAA